MDANENLEKKRKYAIAIVKMGSVCMNIGIILPFCILLLLGFQVNIVRFTDIINYIINDILFFIIDHPLIDILLLVSGFILFLIGLLSFVLFLIGLLKKNNENLKNALVEFGFVLMKSNIIPLFYCALHGNETVVTIPFISLVVPFYIGTLPFVSGFLLFLIGLLVGLIGRLKKSARKANENLEKVSSQKSGTDPLVNPGQRHPDESSSEDLPQDIDRMHEKKKKNARVLVEISVALMGGSILLLLHDFYSYKASYAFGDYLDGKLVVEMLPILIEELIFVLGFLLLLIVLLVGLIGRLKKFACKANDLERETNAMMRDPNQTGQSQSQESHPSRRTVIAGLVATGGVAAGGGAIWWVLTPHPHPLYVYRGHSMGVNAVAWSPDGKHIVSGSVDNTVQVWDAVDGSHVLIYKGHSADVRAVAWSPSKRIASGSGDDTVQVWDATDGGHVFTYRGHSGSVQAVAWSPDGKRIASAGGFDDNTVQVWDTVDGSHVFTYRGHSDAVNAVAWSSDGKRIASGSGDKTVQVWDAVDGSHVFIYKGLSAAVNAVAWSPDGKRIASGSGDNTVQVWEAVDGGHVFTYKGHSDWTRTVLETVVSVNAVAWSPDGKRIASGSGDNTVQVWDAVDGSQVFIYKGHSADVGAVAWSPDGKRIASGSEDYTVQVWEASLGWVSSSHHSIIRHASN